MYKICRTAQSARRQRQMEQGLLAAMEKRRYEDITVCELCRGMGISRKAFYRYFDSKDDALYALLDRALAECDAAMRYTGQTLALGELEKYFRFWREHKRLLDALRQSGLSSQLIECALRYKAGAEEDSQKGSVTLVFLFLMLQWHRGGYAQTPAEMACEAAQILGRPLLKIE